MLTSRFIPDRTHMDLYKVGDDRYGLFDEIGAEMRAVARDSPSGRTRLRRHP